MGNIKKEIISAAERMNVSISEMEEAQTSYLVHGVIEKYTNGKKSTNIWENLVDEFSVNDKNAWIWIEDYISDNEAIMFFNQEDEKNAFLFHNGHDVVSLLGDTYGFEFYLTNRNIDYLLCFNHHDVLIACGDSRDWLSRYKA